MPHLGGWTLLSPLRTTNTCPKTRSHDDWWLEAAACTGEPWRPSTERDRVQSPAEKQVAHDYLTRPVVPRLFLFGSLAPRHQSRIGRAAATERSRRQASPSSCAWLGTWHARRAAKPQSEEVRGSTARACEGCGKKRPDCWAAWPVEGCAPGGKRRPATARAYSLALKEDRTEEQPPGPSEQGQARVGTAGLGIPKESKAT